VEAIVAIVAYTTEVEVVIVADTTEVEVEVAIVADTTEVEVELTIVETLVVAVAATTEEGAGKEDGEAAGIETEEAGENA
jgi:hypothetical protein